MIKDIVFHIGDPKTGSSSIQKTLHSRAWRCDSLTIAPQKELNASALANALNPKRNPKIFQQEIQKKIQWAAETDADLGIISAEFFAAVDPRDLMRVLQEFLPAYADRARVVAYVRPHASRIVSGYAQRVKTGTVASDFQAFLNQLAASREFLYFPRFKRWHEVFGKRFTLRPFIREELRDGDVTTDFFHVALRGAAFSLNRVAATNESLTLEEIAGMRVVQSVLAASEVQAFLRLSIGGAIGHELAGLSDRSRNKLALSRKEAEGIVERYRADARKLDAKFFDGEPMEKALTDAFDQAEESTGPVVASAYFKPATIKLLQGLTKDLAKLVNRKPHAWRRSYQLRIGQLDKETTDPLTRQQHKNAAAVWEVLEKITRTLAKDHIS